MEGWIKKKGRREYVKINNEGKEKGRDRRKKMGEKI